MSNQLDLADVYFAYTFPSSMLDDFGNFISGGLSGVYPQARNSLFQPNKLIVLNIQRAIGLADNIYCDRVFEYYSYVF